MNKILLILFLSAFSIASNLELKGSSVIGKNIYGLGFNYKNKPLTIDEKSQIAEKPLFNGFLTIEDKEDEINQDFMVSTFKINDSIGSVYLTKVNKTDNNITAMDTNSLNLSAIHGVSPAYNGFKTSWNTYLFSQAESIDPKNYNNFQENFKPYFQNKTDLIKPYNYGWPFEVVVLNAKGEARAIKHFSLGRTFSEIIKVMPDHKTVYMYDSKFSKNLYMFISEKEKDFTKGFLYVAKQSAQKIKWIKLGKFSALKTKIKLKKGVEFKTIFSYKKPKNTTCPKGYKFSDTIYGNECLKVQKKMKKYVGVFEPIRFSSMNGVKAFLNNINSVNVKNDGISFLEKNKERLFINFTTDKNLKSNYVIKEIK